MICFLPVVEDFLKPVKVGATLGGADGLAKYGACSTLTKLAFDPVEVLDLAQDPATVFGGFSSLKGVVKSTAHVSPAANGSESLLVFVVPGFDEGLVGLVAVALEGAGEAFWDEGFEAVVAAIVVPLVEGVAFG